MTRDREDHIYEPTTDVEPAAGDDYAFEGTSRFAIRRQLGSGAFGTVYEAWDREQQAVVALKVLRSRRPDLLLRFKREFRSLVDVRHAHLVRLYELFSESNRWFYTMEFVDGPTFLGYVRPDNRCDIDRLRTTFVQLVQGVHALHRARRLHRDLKPANALVHRDGRLVILDFSLVREIGAADPEQLQTHVGGTPAYMAPEQMIQGAVTEAADWYAAGVMLFEAVTGRRPPRAHGWGSSDAGSTGRESVASLLEGAPADLAHLCDSLLRIAPHERPGPAAILATLAQADSTVSPSIESRPPEDDRFVGRAAELHQLRDAFAATREGHLSVVLIEGRSGIGKTALVENFLSTLHRDQRGLIVLKGRCYEFESVPFKGVDALIDELSRYLERLPEARVEALLPRDAFLLPTMFPVLGRVKAIATAPSRPVVPDAQEVRQRTFAALREVLGKLADRHPVVIWIDDLQWGDRDSSTLLADICEPRQSPPLLMVLTFRSEERASSQALNYLQQVLSTQRLAEGLREITVDQLTDAESRQLLEAVAGARPPAVIDKIVAEARGHPLFLQQLMMHVAATTRPLSDNDVRDLKLRGVLQQRVRTLPRHAREALELLSLAAYPLTAAVLFAAVNADDADDAADTLALLTRESLARVSGTGAERRLEPYHDQIRSAVVELMSPLERQARHARLAQVLARLPDAEPQMLVVHYQQAGDVEAAFGASLRAAEAAEAQLAFDGAAVFYETALDTGAAESLPRKAELRQRLAHTLGLAGRGREAAAAYLLAAESAGADQRLRLECLAADQLMRSGYVDESLTLVERLAGTVGITVPRTPAETIRGIVWARIAARIRLLRAPRRVMPTPNPDDTDRLELLRTCGVILNIADPVLAAYFQTYYVLAALKAGHPIHLAVALAIESSIRVAGGTRNPAPAFALNARAEALARETGDQKTIGLVLLTKAYLDYLLCRVPDGIEHSTVAIAYLREQCTGVAWELTVGYVLRFWCLCWCGHLEDVRDELPRLLKDGAARGDVNLEVSLRLLSYIHYSYLSLDRPLEYIDEANRALDRWSRRGYHLQNYGAMFGIVESYLYLGESAKARERLLADWQTMMRSFILRWQTLRVMVWFLRGRVALACWLDRPDEQSMRQEVLDCAKRLGRMNSPWCRSLKLLLTGMVAAGDGRRSEAARALEDAADGLERVSLRAYAAAARHVSGQLYDDAHGAALLKSAADFLADQRVSNPIAFLDALVPGSGRRKF
jgi:eukaryotic-like serine/threonine-protein kinase